MFLFESVEATITIGLTISLVIIITILFRLYYKRLVIEKKIRNLTREIQDGDMGKIEILRRLREIEDESIL